MSFVINRAMLKQATKYERNGHEVGIRRLSRIMKTREKYRFVVNGSQKTHKAIVLRLRSVAKTTAILNYIGETRPQ